MSRFLLDSHALLWWAEEPELLSIEARHAIADGRHLVFVSVASIWELGIKQAAGKLKIPEEVRTSFKTYSTTVQAVWPTGESFRSVTNRHAI